MIRISILRLKRNGVKVSEGDVIGRGGDVVVLQIVAPEEGGINDLRTAKVDGQYGSERSHLDMRAKIAVNDVVDIRHPA